MINKYAYGFPTTGENDEYKALIENFKFEQIDQNELFDGLWTIENEIEKNYDQNVDLYPTNEMTLQDHVLDTSILLGRYTPNTLQEYYKLCYGKNKLETKKWFDTEKTYFVPDFTDFDENDLFYQTKFKITGEHPYLLGPYTFLKLSTGIPKDKFKDFAIRVAKLYQLIIDDFLQVHIDEPAFTGELDSKEMDIIREMYDIMSKTRMNTKINVFTYYENLEWIYDIFDLPVNGIGIDFINGKDNYENVLKVGFPKDKILFAGLVDDTTTDKKDILTKYDKLNGFDGVGNVVVTNSKPLYHYDTKKAKGILEELHNIKPMILVG